MKVTSKIFGEGTVISEDAKAQIVTVNFNGEEKKMMVKYAGLTLEDGSIYKLAAPKKVYVKEPKMTAEERAAEWEATKEAIIDSNRSARSESRKGFGYIHK